MSNTHVNEPINNDGIVFTVTVGSTDHTCLITHDALQALCHSDEDAVLDKEIFWEFEDHIHWVARRLVNAGEWGNPLVLEPRYFS